MSKEAFEQWYMSLHGSDSNDLKKWGKETSYYNFYGSEYYELAETRLMFQAWEEQQARIDELSNQLEQAQNDRNHYGVHLATALKGDKLPSEPVDGRLDLVRVLVARNAELEHALERIIDLCKQYGVKI